MTHETVHPVRSGKPSAAAEFTREGHASIVRRVLKKHQFDSRGRPDSLILAALESLEELARESGK